MKVFKENGITHLDLHGIRHNDVNNEILDFTYQYQSEIPLLVICGNSNKMIEIVKDSLESHSIMFSMPRFGIIRIEKI
jgi:hypothetical protein|tara:strand:- start:1461 stop:1694 length:234 start_codon:yes stop_codon:yes gene_type:complete